MQIVSSDVKVFSTADNGLNVKSSSAQVREQ